jgi:hypothetical protein
MRGLAIVWGALALMLMGGSAHAQAWFGVPTPGPLSPVDKPTFVTNADAYGPGP